MKKLILVTTLAVAASWLLSDRRREAEEQATRAEIARIALDPADRPVGVARPGHDFPMILAPATPVQADPPRPPDVIRVVPWNHSASVRPRRTALPLAPSVRPSPPWFPKTETEEESLARPDASGHRVLLGRLSASEDRAGRDLRQLVDREVSAWLAADVPTSWKVPDREIKRMILGSHTQEVARSLDGPASGLDPSEKAAEIPGLDSLYTLHRAGQKLDFSPSRRARIVAAYRKEVASARMHRLGGGLAVALVGLAVLSGYIKADEATKGYYTNRLRLVAGAGLGTAGVAAYRYFA